MLRPEPQQESKGEGVKAAGTSRCEAGGGGDAEPGWGHLFSRVGEGFRRFLCGT